MELYKLGNRHHKNKNLFSRLITRWCKYKMASQYGCYISFKAFIASDCKFIHPTAIVIGEGVRIHAGCQIYQCVTIGAARQDEANDNRYPVIEHNCILFAGAKVIGNVTIGYNSIIGANSVVNKDIPPHLIAAGAPARIIGEKK